MNMIISIVNHSALKIVSYNTFVMGEDLNCALNSDLPKHPIDGATYSVTKVYFQDYPVDAIVKCNSTFKIKKDVLELSVTFLRTP